MRTFFLPLVLLAAMSWMTPVVAQSEHDVRDQPDVRAALEKFQASVEKSRKKLLAKLEKAEANAKKSNQVELAASIRELKEGIAAGDPVPFEDTRVRKAIAGSAWDWGIDWKKTGMVAFTEAEIIFRPISGPTPHKYVVTDSRTLVIPEDGRKLIFNEDFTKFVAVTKDVKAYYTGVRAKGAAPPIRIPTISPPPTGAIASALENAKTGDQWQNSVKMTFLCCPPGKFKMGGPGAEVDVTLTEKFWMGRFEVTQRQWQDVMGTTPWEVDKNTKIGERYPAVRINAEDAAEFCRRLTKLEHDAGRIPQNWKYALPTEAQWEYACRAGTNTTYSFGDDPSKLNDYAWWGANRGQGNAKNEQDAHLVAGKLPNPWGFYDMHGNVWEFVRDNFRDKLPGGTDPFVEIKGGNSVFRGGSWFDAASFCTSYQRIGRSGTGNNLGFRAALVPSKQTAVPPVIAKNAESLDQAETGEAWDKNSLKMPLLYCSPGKFQMGAPGAKVVVTLSTGFWLGKHEVTQAEWQDVMGTITWTNSRDVKRGPKFPAANMSKSQALEFCQKLTKRDRDSGDLPASWEYTLPTEAQWEYACRAGTTTQYIWGDDLSQINEYAWWGYGLAQSDSKNDQFSHEVGKKKPNAWGFHDMHGNLWEFARDDWRETTPGGIDPLIKNGDTSAVFRGGCWASEPSDLASHFRKHRETPSGSIGFRVALVPVNGAMTNNQVADAQLEKLLLGKSIDLLAPVNLADHVVRGTWNRNGKTITCNAELHATLMTPFAVKGDYEIDFEFTRKAGDDAVMVLCPMGDYTGGVVLDYRVFSGLHVVDGVPPDKISPNTGAATKTGKLVNGKRYRMQISVSQSGRMVSVIAKLNNQQFVKWRGLPSSVSVLPGVTLPCPGVIGVMVHKAVADIHKLELTVKRGGEAYALGKDFRSPITQVDDVPPEGIADQCITWNGKSYFISKDPLSRIDAQRLATRWNARLLTFSSPEEEAFWFQKGQGRVIWLSGWHRPGDPIWKDDRNRPLKHIGKWSGREPSNSQGEGWLGYHTESTQAPGLHDRTTVTGIHTVLEWGEEYADD